MKRLRVLTILLIPVALLIHWYKNSIVPEDTFKFNQTIPDEWYLNTDSILTPVNDIRPADQTFLTFPEWFLVFSPIEQAEFLKTNTSTEYDYVSQVNQFWDSYEILNNHLSNHYTYNKEYHDMIKVIGGSTAIEYYSRTFYETLIGRLTQGSEFTEEDRFNQRYNEEYAYFLFDQPWYKYDYGQQLSDLWSETSLFGSNFLRKCERKYFLTTELLVKMGYAKLIGFGSQSLYGEISTNTVVVVDSITKSMSLYGEYIQQKSSNYIYLFPRYARFTDAMMVVAKEGVNVSEIAGNNSVILVSIIADKSESFEDNLIRTLFSQRMILNDNKNRLVIATPVSNLCDFIRMCIKRKIEIEHIFDY